MLIRSLILLPVVFLAGCRSQTPPGAAEAENQAPAGARPQGTPARALPRVVVDPSLEEADPEASPPVYPSLQQALAAHPRAPVEVVIRGGHHQGPFSLTDGTLLRGEAGRPPPVLALGPEGALLQAQGTLTLDHLVLRGGASAIEGGRVVRLRDVTLEGQTLTPLTVQGGQRLEAHGLRIEAPRPSQEGWSASGLKFEGKASAKLRDVTFQGPRKRAIELTGEASLEVEGLTIRGVDAGLHQRGGRVVLKSASVVAAPSSAFPPEGPREASVGGGASAAIYVAGGALTLQGVRTRGHEFGVLTGAGAVVEGADLTLVGALRAGLGLSQTKATLRGVRVSAIDGRRGFAGIQVLGSEVHLTDLELRDVGTLGLSQRGGTLVLERATIVGVRGGDDGTEGSGISARAGVLKLRDVAVSQTTGPGMVVAESARVSGGPLRIRGGLHAGVVVETRGALDLERLEVHACQGPALFADEEVGIRVGVLVSEANRGGVALADCDGDTRVELGLVEGQALASASTCIDVGGSSRPSEARSKGQ